MKRRTRNKIDIDLGYKDDESDLQPDFKQESMIMQLRKIVDSIGNPTPLHWVRTDNGRNVWIAYKHAKTIISLYDRLTSREATGIFVDNRTDPAINATLTRAKRQLTESLQTTEGLNNLIKELRQA